jgi:hypothetical protein
MLGLLLFCQCHSAGSLMLFFVFQWFGDYSFCVALIQLAGAVYFLVLPLAGAGF